MASREESNNLLPVEISKAADRAGDVVRDQIASIADAAQDAADRIERDAREAAAESRAQSSASAARVHSGLVAIERELDVLLREVSAQASRLKRTIDRFDARTSQGETAPPPDAESATEHVHGKRVLGAPAPDDVEPEPEAEEPEVEEPEAEVQPEVEEPEAEVRPEVEEPREEAATGGQSRVLEAEAWRRARGMQPAELVALYDLSTGDRKQEDEHDDSDLDWSFYWPALHDAVISEALEHKDFPETLPDDPSLTRRERRSRAKALEALNAELSSRRAS